MKIRKKEQSWKEVVVIDGACLERWLAEAPAVSAWHARNTLKLAPVEAVRSTDEFWNDFANRFAPPLIEEVLTTERESLVEELLGTLTRPECCGRCPHCGPARRTQFRIALLKTVAAKEGRRDADRTTRKNDTVPICLESSNTLTSNYSFNARALAKDNSVLVSSFQRCSRALAKLSRIVILLPSASAA